MSQDETQPTEMKIGDRVRLNPDLNWISRFAPLAESGRVGTVISLPNDFQACIEFDVVRRGTKPIRQCFAPRDLILCNVPAIQQSEIVL